MFYAAGGGSEVGACVLEEEVVGIRIVYLVASALGAGIDAQEGDMRAEVAVDAAGALFDVGTGALADEIGGVVVLFGHDEGVLELSWVGARIVAVHGLDGVGGEG